MMKTANKLFTLTAFAFSSFIAQSADIQLEITGIKNDQGKLYIQLFNGEENYNRGKAELATIAKAKPGTVALSFHDVAAGEYAVRFFHDENDNGTLDSNLFGIPNEGYGFSNGAQPNFGPAKYQDMKFRVNGSDIKLSNKVIY
ncbi:DUF2141 domain-containing protein [Thalassomonas viridans]|uniref:DUF2141 domain-containing protein n=1 Tax=Thalassomonas viridans TaxID=137584 RepID=A0AAF0CBD3_9GAMM|nr:DUF2141 domain-containing protein [Thalassomonas viridans]WDE07723.1 DUF2141 domain-containing protein [Thalassomonas viridans]